MLNREAIGRLIPHQGSMCLLDHVVRWNADHVECVALSHREALNPLRAFGRLGIAAGIEYAAQAMAVHGALVGEVEGQAGARPRAGYLASVRGVSLHAVRLDDLPSPLRVRAQRLMGDSNNIVYSFEVAAEERLLLRGRATVVLDAAMAQRVAAGESS